MSKKLFFISWNKGSKGLSELKKAYGLHEMCYVSYATVLSKPLSYKNAVLKNYTVVNWGARPIPNLPGINQNATDLSDKLGFLVGLSYKHSNLVPKFTTDKTFVESFLKKSYLLAAQPSSDVLWVARQYTKASSGKGITLLKSKDWANVPTAPLYVKYTKKADEYRIHFFRKYDGHFAFFFQKKKLLKNAEFSDTTFKIRNLANGWVFSSRNFELPPAVYDCALKIAGSAYLNSLTFGALDIIYNKDNEAAYCLEVNTAPGLSAPTAKWYAEHFAELTELL